MEKINIPDKQIEIGDVTFHFIKTQREGKSHIYKSEDKTKILRIGEKEKIEEDLRKHQTLLEQGYPVAKVLDVGELGNDKYFIEECLGDKLFGEILKSDFEMYGRVMDESFQLMIDGSSKMLRVQIANSSSVQNWDELLTGVHVDWLIEELPEIKESVLKRIELCKKRLTNIPFVFSHGDYNAYNLFPKGVIDFEDGFYAPVGFDCLGLMVYPEYFPTKDVAELEINGGYKFSDEQRQKYFNAMNSILIENGLPGAEEIYEEIRFLKSIWLTVKMHRWPKMQEYRYELFKKIL